VRREWIFLAAPGWLLLIGIEFWQWCRWGGAVLDSFCFHPEHGMCDAQPSTAPPSGLPLLTALLIAGTVAIGFALHRQDRLTALTRLAVLGAVPAVLVVLVDALSGAAGATAAGLLAGLLVVLLAGCAVAALDFAFLGLGAGLAHLTRRRT
jgi:hypothetical protein